MRSGKDKAVAAWNTRAAPPEDVRAVVDEPVGYRCRRSENEPWFFSDRPGYWEWEPIYRHPQPPMVLPDLGKSFEKWWQQHGQYCRSGGGNYEKTFAYRAYEACIARIVELNK